MLLCLCVATDKVSTNLYCFNSILPFFFQVSLMSQSIWGNFDDAAAL